MMSCTVFEITCAAASSVHITRSETVKMLECNQDKRSKSSSVQELAFKDPQSMFIYN